MLLDPLLVEAIEDLFVPTLVFNNRDGQDKIDRERFEEPAWNNPVVRFTDAAGKDVIPRQDRVWSPVAVAARMVTALDKAGGAPPWLKAYSNELAGRARARRTTLAMYCYWEGEAVLGGLPGVLQSEAAHFEGQEVVELRWDPKQTTLKDILAVAGKFDCARRVWVDQKSDLKVARDAGVGPAALKSGTSRSASASDQKHKLQRTPLAKLPTTPQQTAWLNAEIGRSGVPKSLPADRFSPRQRAAAQGLLKPQ